MCKLASVCTRTNTLFIMLPDKKKALAFRFGKGGVINFVVFFFELCTTGRLLYKGDNKNDINPFCPDAYSPLHVHWRLDICASSADSDEMSHLTAFHLVLHFLKEWHFTCIRKRKQKKTFNN